MMGSFLTRGLVMALGYAYPAYECFKTVERNKPDIEQLRFWCQYWILVAVLTVLERVGDAFISWLPMYSEAKLAFFVYLWYPKTRGTAYVYDSFLRPYVAKHETEIDRNLMELRTRAGDMAVLYWQKAASYGQTRVFEILQYVASQSQRPRPAQQQPGVRPPPPTAKSRQPAAQQPQQAAPSLPSNAASAQPQSRQTSNSATATAQPPSRQSSNVATAEVCDREQQVEANPVPPSPASKIQATSTSQASTESVSSTQAATPSEVEAMQVEIESTVGVANGSPNPTPPETVMEDAIRVTRGRLRKTRAAATAKH